jgi:alanine racemase
LKAQYLKFVNRQEIALDASIQAHVEVDLNAIQANATTIKARTGGQLIAVVKADAYGHGAIPVAEALHTIADMFAVATVEEGVDLREAGIQNPILILFSPLPDLTENIVSYDLTPAVDNWILAEKLNKIIKDGKSRTQQASTKKVKVHIDVNTGMNRCGVRYTEAAAFLKKLKTLSHLEVEGIFTHFATADETDKSFAHLQLNRFSSVLTSVPNVPIKHAANSAAVLAIPESHFDAVRPGLSLYGIYPAEEKPIQLQPALTWKASVSWVNFIEQGEGVSYGLTYKAQHRTHVAGIQVGYGDGYPRALSGIGEVLIGGKRCPIVGRICMDMMVVQLDLLDNVAVGDEVVLIGKQGNEQIKIYEVADRANTIPYEILTNINKRVNRIYT